MFEETNHSCSKARFNACMSQCRIARFLSGGTVFDGNCTCEKPYECMVNLHTLELPFNKYEYFPDVVAYWRDLVSE